MPILSTLVETMVALPGATGSAVVDIDSGETLAKAGQIPAEIIEIAGTTNARLLRSKMAMVRDRYHQRIEDVLITLTDDYHLIRLVRCPGNDSRLFLYLILSRAEANLAYSRRKLAEMEESLTCSEGESRLLEIECDYALDRDNIRDKVEGMISNRGNNPVSSDVRDEEAFSFMNTEVALRLLGIDFDAVQACGPNSADFPETIK